MHPLLTKVKLFIMKKNGEMKNESDCYFIYEKWEKDCA